MQKFYAGDAFLQSDPANEICFTRKISFWIETSGIV